MTAQTTDDILAARKGTHGEFAEHARCTQGIMRTMQQERNWPDLSDMQKESLHMMSHKMARIVTGDPNQPDHWDDAAGYARLISQRLGSTPKVFMLDEDILGALARGWGITPEAAAARIGALGYGQPAPTAGSGAPAADPTTAPAAPAPARAPAASFSEEGAGLRIHYGPASTNAT